MHLNQLETMPHPTPGPWKNCLPQNRFLVPKRLGTPDLRNTYSLLEEKMHCKDVSNNFIAEEKESGS